MSLAPRIRPRATLLVALTLISIALALRAADSHAARGMEIAIQDDNVIVNKSYFNRDKALKLARAFGVTRVRINLQWAYTLPPGSRNSHRRPSPLRYEFPIVDAAINAAAKYGMRVQLALTGPAPAWAEGKRRVGPYKPNPAAFGEWVRMVAKHFRGRVDRYSIWNEPNINRWLAPLRSSPKIYRSLYRRGYDAIKAQVPEAQVLFGETSPYSRPGFSTAPLAWLRKALCVSERGKRNRHCPKFRADGFAHHPYDFAHAANYRYPGADNVTMGTLDRLTRALDRFSRAGALRKNGGGRLPIYLTEYGYFSSGPRALPKRKRTKYLAQGWSIALKNRRVKSNLQYLVASPPRRSSSAYFNLALLTTRGKKYPTYNTLVRWYRSHRPKVKRPGGPISLPPVPTS